MGEFIKIFLQVFKEHPFDLISNCLKYMRVIFLLIVSHFLYYDFVEHFTICKNADEIVGFFIKLTFIKCFLFYILIYIVFDALTKLSIIIAFNFSTKQYFKKADDINKKILEDKESFVKAFNEKMNKINSTINKIFRKNGDHLKYKVEETNKYDNFSLLMVQLIYVNIFSGLNSLFVYVLSVILFLLGQFLKGMNLFNERMYKNIF